MFFNGEKITQESIIATRQHFADIYQACINGALDGTEPPASHVNIAEYVAQHEENIRAMLAGERQNNFTFMQRAYWIQTGKCIALLP